MWGDAPIQCFHFNNVPPQPSQSNFNISDFRSLDGRSGSSTPPVAASEDLRKLRVGKFEFTPTYYHDRKRLQIIIRRVTCYPVYQSLQNVAYLYIVACLLPDRRDFFESDLQQIHEDNMVDEMCEFEVAYDDIVSRVLLFEIHVCDRFSKHLIIGEFRYNLLPKQDSERETPIEKLDVQECSVTPKQVSVFLQETCYQRSEGESFTF